MVLESPRRPLVSRTYRDRRREPINSCPRRGLRGLPDRSPCSRRRTAGAEAATHSRPRDRRPSRRDWSGVHGFQIGQRIGIPWLGWTCGQCRFCLTNRENLCDRARYTGYTIDGGYAEYTVADARFCFPIPGNFEDVAAAPLLCAGLIGYRCLRKAGGAKRLGIYGFGAAAHIVAQVARYEGRDVFAFTTPGDVTAQDFAPRRAKWAGGSDQNPPQALDAAIIFAPVGPLVPAALRVLERGGTVVCGGIHMSDIPSFPYHELWQERTICSVANLTRRDGEEFLALAPRVPIRTETQKFPLEQANEALMALRSGSLSGAAVLVP